MKEGRLPRVILTALVMATTSLSACGPAEQTPIVLPTPSDLDLTPQPVENARWPATAEDLETQCQLLEQMIVRPDETGDHGEEIYHTAGGLNLIVHPTDNHSLAVPRQYLELVSTLAESKIAELDDEGNVVAGRNISGYRIVLVDNHTLIPDEIDARSNEAGFNLLPFLPYDWGAETLPESEEQYEQFLKRRRAGWSEIHQQNINLFEAGLRAANDSDLPEVMKKRLTAAWQFWLDQENSLPDTLGPDDTVPTNVWASLHSRFLEDETAEFVVLYAIGHPDEEPPDIYDPFIHSDHIVWSPRTVAVADQTHQATEYCVLSPSRVLALIDEWFEAFVTEGTECDVDWLITEMLARVTYNMALTGNLAENVYFPVITDRRTGEIIGLRP